MNSSAFKHPTSRHGPSWHRVAIGLTLALWTSTLALPRLQAQGGPGGPGPGPGGNGQGQAFRSARIEERSSTVTLGGRLKPLRTIDQSAGINGLVSRILVSPGQHVRKGQILMEIVRDQAGETWLPLQVQARIDGKVSRLGVSEGNEVSATTRVCTLMDDSSLVLETWVSDLDAYRIRDLKPGGLKARTGNKAGYPAYLEGISLEPDYDTGLFTARFRLPPAAGLRPGLVVFIPVPVALSRGIFVDRSLLQRRFGHTMLWVLDDQGLLTLREVNTGETFGDEVQVTGGIEAGTRYLTRLKGDEKEGQPLAGAESGQDTSPRPSPRGDPGR